MLDVNFFDELRIGLATADDILDLDAADLEPDADTDED